MAARWSARDHRATISSDAPPPNRLGMLKQDGFAKIGFRSLLGGGVCDLYSFSHLFEHECER